MQTLTALVTRLRGARADALAVAATTLYTRASKLYVATDPEAPQANRRRYEAHRLAAHAERLTARSYRWRPAPAKES